MAISTGSSLHNFDNWWFWIRKTNKLLNLIKEQDYHDVIDNIYLHARDLNEPNTMDDVYEDIDKYNPKKDKKF